MILDIPSHELPLCPNQLHPVHPSHQLHVQIQDDAYKSLPTNEELEFNHPDSTVMYNAISNKRFDSRMRLYREGVNTLNSSRFLRVESWYFRCSICGLILPAQIDMSKV
jgi:hypothetical protein